MQTDWHQEIEVRLVESKIYRTLRNRASEESVVVDSQVSSIVHEGVKYAYDKAKLIVKYLPQYTLHDSEHLFRVLYLMEKLVPEENLSKLSVPELMLLILSAFFHDLGMCPKETEISAWKKQWQEAAPNPWELEHHSNFVRFQNTHPDIIKEIEQLRGRGEFAKGDLLEQHLISEYIRINHTKRVKELIAADWKGKIRYQESDLTRVLAEICYSHNEDALKLLNLDSNYLCGEGVNLCIPFVALILRLSDLLDFDAKRTPSILFSHLSVKNPVSLVEWQKHRAVKAWRITPEEIAFSAECGHPAIEAAINKFCDYIDDELRDGSVIISKLLEQNLIGDFSAYKIKFPVEINRKRITAERDIATGEPLYEYWNTTFELNKNQVIELLMGTQLYANKEVALRELIQNSIDACLLSDALHKSWLVPYNPLITIKYYSLDGEDYLEVNDNGVGMDKEIITKYYSKVGSSFYRSKDFYDLKAQTELHFTPISRFGIGILSMFMVSDSVEVETKRLKGQYDYDLPLKIVVEGYDSIFTVLKSKKLEPGTSTKLLLKKNHPWVHLTPEALVKTIKTAVPHPQIPVKIITRGGEVLFTASDFVKRSAGELKGHYWSDDDNIRQVEFAFKDSGFLGNAIVGVVEQENEPVESVDVHSNDVEIDGENYNLSLEIQWAQNEIEKKGDSIQIDDSGEIRSDSHSQTLAKSNALFSIHGIHYGGGLFPEYSFSSKKACLRWPFPMLLVLDISGANDLDLNSARNEIVFNENWHLFEQKLSYVICKNLRDILPQNYVAELFRIFQMKSKNENFLIGLSRVSAE